MHKTLLATLGLAVSLFAGAAAHADDRVGGSAAITTATIANASFGLGVSTVQHHRNWNRQVRGRWYAGWSAPGGWGAYRRPVTGWVLPAYWIDRSFYIADWGFYALPAPAYGLGWSRYYDDAVLTDRWGRIVDVRYRYDWDRRDRHDRYRGEDRRTQPYAYDDGVTYRGQWTGTWHGEDGSRYSGTYDGRFDGDASSAPVVSLPYAPLPAYGYALGGRYYEGGIGRVSYGEVAYAEPVVTTTVTEETTWHTVKKAAVKRRAPAHRRYVKPRCTCSCTCR